MIPNFTRFTLLFLKEKSILRGKTKIKNEKSKKKKTLDNIKTSVPDKRSPSSNICLEEKNGLTFDPSKIFEVFQKLFFNLANDSHFPKDCKVANLCIKKALRQILKILGRSPFFQ